MAQGSDVAFVDLSCPFPGPRARSRLCVALGVSALVHAALASLITGGPAGGSAPSAAQPVLTVRIIDVRPTAPQAAPAIERDAVREPERLPRRAAAAKTPAPAVAADVQSVLRSAGAGAAVEGPDSTYYPAKQLDVYPTLLSELALRSVGAAVPSEPPARARLLVLIDELGNVNEASVVEGEPASRFEDARRAFMTARFTPAYRNGRAVRSRVLIELNYGEASAMR